MNMTVKAPERRRQHLRLADRTIRRARGHRPRGHRPTQRSLREEARRYRRPGATIRQIMEAANSLVVNQKSGKAAERANLAYRMALPLGSPERHRIRPCRCCGKAHPTRQYRKACVDRHYRDGSDNWDTLSGAVLDLFLPSLDGEYSHWDNAGRGELLRYEVLAYDPDQDVAIILAERVFRLYRSGWLNRHKNYLLVGFNEVTRQPFRHAVSGRVLLNVARSERIRAAQKWMWRITDEQLDGGRRQGDVFLAPVKLPRGEPVPEAVLGGSHRIRGREVRRDTKGRVFALDPRLAHLKRQHAPVRLKGWFRVCIAREEAAWDFAVRIGD